MLCRNIGRDPTFRHCNPNRDQYKDLFPNYLGAFAVGMNRAKKKQETGSVFRPAYARESPWRLRGAPCLFTMKPESKFYLSQIEHIRSLLAEQRAITFWDNKYWKSQDHEVWETAALNSRFRRRADILAELETIIGALLRDSA
jgi:hypothetical protein